MPRMKHASKRRRGKQSVPILGVAGMSLALAGGAFARTSEPATHIPSRDTAPRHHITLNDEEISDINLATFYVFDKENARTLRRGEKLAWGCRGCGCRGCGGCGGFRGCGGCRGCVGCRGCGGCSCGGGGGCSCGGGGGCSWGGGGGCSWGGGGGFCWGGGGGCSWGGSGGCSCGGGDF